MLTFDYKERGNVASLLKNIYLLIEAPQNQITNQATTQFSRDILSESIREYFIYRRMLIRQSQSMFNGFLQYFKQSEPNLVEKVQIFNMDKYFCIFKIADFVTALSKLSEASENKINVNELLGILIDNKENYYIKKIATSLEGLHEYNKSNIPRNEIQKALANLDIIPEMKFSEFKISLDNFIDEIKKMAYIHQIKLNVK